MSHTLFCVYNYGAKINFFVIFSRFVWFVFEMFSRFAIKYSLDDCWNKPEIYVTAILLIFYKGEKKSC